MLKTDGGGLENVTQVVLGPRWRVGTIRDAILAQQQQLDEKSIRIQGGSSSHTSNPEFWKMFLPKLPAWALDTSS
jgi:hypothetical protein